MLTNQVDAKAYFEAYLERYQRMVDSSYHASASVLEFYQGLPASVDAYIMPNDAVIGIVKYSAGELKVNVYSGRYDQVKAEMKGRTFGHMLAIFPSHPTSVEEIDAAVKFQIEGRLRDVGFSQYMKDVVLGIVNIEGQISEISKTNPWLSKQFGELTQMLSDARKRSEEVSGQADALRERRMYDRFEEMVDWLESYDTSRAPTQLDAIDIESARTYLTEFIRSYRATIDAKSLGKEAYPPFYTDYPYTVEFSVLPNKNVIAFFSRATEGMRFQERQLGFSELDKELPTKVYDYMLALPNCLKYDKSNAVKLAQSQANNDLELHELMMALEEQTKRIKSIEAQIIKIKKSNPWLEQQLSGLLKTLETCNKPISTLRSRLEKSRKAGVILRAGFNYFSSHISVLPTSGAAYAATAEAPPQTAAPYVYPTEQVPEFQAIPTTPEYEMHPPGEAALMGDAAVVSSTAVPGASTEELNELKAMLYTFERKLADYDKRLHYIDKYTEMIQRQQNKKFKAQKELVDLEARKGRWGAIGVGVGALAIALIVLLANIDAVADLFSKLFGG